MKVIKVTVEIAEVHKSIREIEVPDSYTDEEIRRAAEKDAGDADELNLEYSHTLPHSEWTIRKEGEDYVR